METGIELSFLRFIHQSPELSGALYWDFYAAAFVIGFLLSKRNARKLNLPLFAVNHLFAISVIGGILGARLFHIFFEDPKPYLEHPLDSLKFWRGGLVFYGGFFASLLGFLGYCRWKKLSVLEYFDAFAPGVVLGAALGRIGCLFAACCYGTVTKKPWGIAWGYTPDGTSVIYRHPSQIYDFLLLAVLGIYLQLQTKFRRYPGQLFWHGLLGMALVRFVTEGFRGDTERGFLFNGTLSQGQFWSFFLCLIATMGIAFYRKKNRE